MEITLSRKDVAEMLLKTINEKFPGMEFNECKLSSGYGIEFATVTRIEPEAKEPA